MDFFNLYIYLFIYSFIFNNTFKFTMHTFESKTVITFFSVFSFTLS